MKTVALFVVLALLGGDAAAQSREMEGGGARITFFERPDFQGRSFTLREDTRNFAPLGFNDRARSARVEGSWRLCEHADYGGRCEPFGSDVRDFDRYGFGGRISSAQMLAGRPGWVDGGAGAAGPWPGRTYRDGVEGRSVVFFRRPQIDGEDVAAIGPRAADAFCREAGFRGAAYHDETERGRRAVDVDGRFHDDVPVLRDVLCRR